MRIKKSKKHKKKANIYMKSRKDAFQKHIEFTARQNPRIERSVSKLKEEPLYSDVSDEEVGHLPKVVVRNSKQTSKAQLYKIPSAVDPYQEENVRQGNAYSSVGIMQRPNRRRKR